MPEVNKDREKKVELNKSRNNEWFKKEFSASAILFWIKGSIAVDYRFVKVVEQNTVLGLIPAGKHKQNIPLKNISAASIDTKYQVKNFVIGIIVALIGLAMFSDSVLFGLLLFLIGVLVFLTGILTELDIEKSGSDYLIKVPFFNKQNMIDAQEAIEQAVTNDIDKTDQSLYHKKLAAEEMDDID